MNSKYGYCKFGKKCGKIHFSDVCEKIDCTGRYCDRRHPIPCFFFEKYKMCKFGTYCSYKHTRQTTLSERKDMEKEVESLKMEVVELKTKVNELTNALENVNKSMKEIAESAKSVETRVEPAEENKPTNDCEKEERNVGEEKTPSDIIRENSEHFYCDKCEFSSKTSRGLNIHIAKLHTKVAKYDGKLYSVEKNRKTGYFELFCFICDFKCVYYIEAPHSQERHWLKMREHFQQKHDYIKIENFTEQRHKIGRT